MMKAALFVCLSTIIITVTSNPVAQVLSAQPSSICQPNPCNQFTLPAAYHPASTQTNSYSQPTTVQNQTPSRSGFEGTVNQLLLSKILEIPGLQKILDPNTKFFNQNGQEIQRHPNAGAVPSVVNNYFIVPPDFFSINDTAVKSNDGLKRKRGNSGRTGTQIQKKVKTGGNDHESNKLADSEHTNRRKSDDSTKSKRRKHKNDEMSAKIIEENVETNNEDRDDLRPIVKKTKRRRKKQDSSEKFEKESKNEIDVNNNDKKSRKRPRKIKTQSPVTEEEISKTPIDTEGSKDTIRTKKKKSNHATRTDKSSSVRKTKEKTKEAIDFSTSSEDVPQLKNIELPVDNEETTKYLTENRKTRNSKNSTPNKGGKSTQTMAPIPDDFLKTFFPYMYPGNYFYPNAFNFEQFYQPNFSTNTKRSKKRKSKTRQNEDKKDSLPNVVNVKLKPKQKETTTTTNPISNEIIEVPIDSSSVEITSKTSEPVTDISMEMPHELSPKEESDESLAEPEPVIPKPDHAAIKAKIEMPPTVIEDLHEFMNLELGKESMVPTIHTNGIISDYYPIFDDASYYASDENYYLKDLEDDRHYYTTDRAHDELINRDRRKYDSYEKPRAPSLDTTDRLFCRRGFICKEIGRVKDADEIDKSSVHYTHASIKEHKNIPASTENNKEISFQTPPLLEKPDFKTKQIEKDYLKSHDDLEQPIYTISHSAERVSDKPDYPETKTAELDRRVNIESEIRKEKGLPKTTRPSNDRIETVFAKTRVVKYGVGKEESEENVPESTPVHEDDGDVKQYNGDRTTYVIAKSLGQVDDYYWK